MSIREVRREATARLTAAGVPSPAVDATLLLAHVVGRTTGELIALDDLSEDELSRYRLLVDRRARREPVQHIIGHVQFGSVDIEVGPGVFIPRMETEILLSWGAEVIRALPAPTVVDLCSGSGALALSLADTHDDAVVHAVELDSDALRWLRLNHSRLPERVRDRVRLYQGDVCDPAVLPGVRADLVVANPPYIPTGAELPIEVADSDPHRALFGGVDGMSVITPMIDTVAAILKSGGTVGIEHDDSTGPLVAATLEAHGNFESVTHIRDLADRPRFVTAMRR